MLKENVELAKWGAQNNAPWRFYAHFDIISDEMVYRNIHNLTWEEMINILND